MLSEAQGIARQVLSRSHLPISNKAVAPVRSFAQTEKTYWPMTEENLSSKLADIDADIKSLKELLELTGEDALKFDQRMKVYARLEKFYTLRLRHSGSGRGGAFK